MSPIVLRPLASVIAHHVDELDDANHRAEYKVDRVQVHRPQVGDVAARENPQQATRRRRPRPISTSLSPAMMYSARGCRIVKVRIRTSITIGPTWAAAHRVRRVRCGLEPGSEDPPPAWRQRSRASHAVMVLSHRRGGRHSGAVVRAFRPRRDSGAACRRGGGRRRRRTRHD